MGDLPIKNRQNQLNKINAQEKNNFRGIFNLNEALKSFSSARPRTRGYHPRAYGNSKQMISSTIMVSCIL